MEFVPRTFGRPIGFCASKEKKIDFVVQTRNTDHPKGRGGREEDGIDKSIPGSFFPGKSMVML